MRIALVKWIAIAIGMLALAATAALAWLYVDAHCDRGEWFERRHGELAAVDVARLESGDGIVAERVQLTSTSGLETTIRIVRPAGQTGPLTTLMLLGGHRTGADAVELFDDVVPALTRVRGRRALFALTNGNADLAAIGLGLVLRVACLEVLAQQVDEVALHLAAQLLRARPLGAEPRVMEALDRDPVGVQLLVPRRRVPVDQVPEPAVVIRVRVRGDHRVQPDLVELRVLLLPLEQVVPVELPVHEVRRALARLLPGALVAPVDHQVMPLGRDHEHADALPHVDEVELEERLAAQIRAVDPPRRPAGVDAHPVRLRILLEDLHPVPPEEVGEVVQTDGVDGDDVVPPWGAAWWGHLQRL